MEVGMRGEDKETKKQRRKVGRGQRRVQSETEKSKYKGRKWGENKETMR